MTLSQQEQVSLKLQAVHPGKVQAGDFHLRVLSPELALSVPGHWRGCHSIAKAASDIPSPVPSAQKKNADLGYSRLQSGRGAYFFSTLLGPVLHLHSTPPLPPPKQTFHSCTIHPWSNLFWGMGVRISESLFVFNLRVRGSQCLILSAVICLSWMLAGGQRTEPLSQPACLQAPHPSPTPLPHFSPSTSWWKAFLLRAQCQILLIWKLLSPSSHLGVSELPLYTESAHWFH